MERSESESSEEGSDRVDSEESEDNESRYGYSVDGAGSGDEDEENEDESEGESNDDEVKPMNFADTTVNDTFFKSVDAAAQAELVGLVREAQVLVEMSGFESDQFPDVLYVLLEKPMRALQTRLHLKFKVATNKPLTMDIIFQYIYANLVAGVYGTTVAALDADRIQRGDNQNAYLRYAFEVNVDDYNVIADLISRSGEDDARPFSANQLIVDLAEAISESFCVLLGYLTKEPATRARLLTGTDDYKCAGSKAEMAGMATHNDERKAVKRGPSFIICATTLLRVPLVIAMLHLDDKEEKLMMADKFKDGLLKHVVPQLGGTGFTRVVGDFDRGSFGMLKVFKELGGIFVATLKKRSKVNRANKFHAVPTFDASVPKYVDKTEALVVSERGPATTLFVQDDKLGGVQAAQRYKNRLTYLATNVPELCGPVFMLRDIKGLKPAVPPDDPLTILVVEAWSALPVRELAPAQGDKLWRVLRKFKITSTFAEQMAVSDDKWRAYYQATNDDYEGVAGPFLADDDLEPWAVRFDADEPDSSIAHVSSATITSAMQYMDTLSKIRLKSGKRAGLPAKLFDVVGDMDDCDIKALVRAARAVRVSGYNSLKVATASEDDRERVSNLILEVIEDKYQPFSFADEYANRADQAFVGNRSTRTGHHLEPVVRAAIPQFLIDYNAAEFARVVPSRNGVYESLRSVHLVDSPDGFVATSKRADPRRAKDVEVHALEIKVRTTRETIDESARLLEEHGAVAGVHLSYPPTEAELEHARAVMEGTLDHLLQVIHHIAVLGVRGVFYVQADGRNKGDIIRAVAITITNEFAAMHRRVCALTGDAHMPWLNDLDAPRATPYFTSKNDFLSSVALSRALRERVIGKPITGVAKGPKTAIASAHDVLKTPTDVIHQETLGIRPDTGPRNAVFNVVTELLLISALGAMRIFRAMSACREAGALRDGFDIARLGGIRRLRALLNLTAGSKRTIILNGARQIDPARFTSARMAAARVARAAAASASPIDDGRTWRPTREEYAKMLALRDAACAGISQSVAFSVEPLTRLRTRELVVNPAADATAKDKELRHLQVNLPSNQRPRCILSCEYCECGSCAGVRRGFKTSQKCSLCGVVLDVKPRRSLGGRSAWEVFHGVEKLPAHSFAVATEAPAAEGQPAAAYGVVAAAASGDGSEKRGAVTERSDSAKKRRHSKKFAHEADLSSTQMRILKLDFQRGGE